MNKNEIKNKFESVHLPINCYLWRFRVGCSSLFMVIRELLKVLHASSQKNCSRVLSAWSPLLSSKVPRENSFCLFPSEKKFLYACILSFIYKAAHSLWNILFPFFSYVRVDMGSPLCVAHLEISLRMQPYLVW